MKSEIEKLIDDVKEEQITPFIQELIQTPSLSGQEKDIAHLLANKMRELHYDDVFIDDMGSVIGIIKGRDRSKKILFNGHIDHVDPGELSKWKYPPYSGTIYNGRMYGRGTVDMKGSVASAILGLGLLKAHKILPECDIIYTGVVHEETREGKALKFIISNIGVPNAVILGEATELDIKIGHRGRAEIEVETYGKIGHSSMPHLADNAVYKMAPIIDSIKDINDNLPIHPFLGKATSSIIYIDASPNLANTIIDKCRRVVDRRTILTKNDISETKESLINEIKNYLTEKGIKVDPSWINIKIRESILTCYTGMQFKSESIMPAWFLEPQHSLCQAGKKSLEKIGLNPKFKKWEFSTDGIYSAGLRKIPTMGFGPGDEREAHQPNESALISDYVTAAKGNAILALDLAKEAVKGSF